jgi:hypothetical protein
MAALGDDIAVVSFFFGPAGFGLWPLLRLARFIYLGLDFPFLVVK